MSIAEQLHNQKDVNNNESKNKEFTGTALTRIVSFLVLVFTIMMFYSFWDEQWTFERYVAFSILTILTLSIIANTLFPKTCWWGFRIVSFFIFCAYCTYLYSQIFITPNDIDLLARQSASSPIKAFFGFLIIGIPALVFTFSGGRNGNYDAENPEKNTEKAILLNNIRKYTFQALLILTFFYIAAILIKFLF